MYIFDVFHDFLTAESSRDSHANGPALNNKHHKQVPNENIKQHYHFQSSGKLDPAPYLRILQMIDFKYPSAERGDALVFVRYSMFCGLAISLRRVDYLEVGIVLFYNTLHQYGVTEPGSPARAHKTTF